MTSLELAQLTEAALYTIAKLANLGGDKAEAALAAIRGVIAALKSGDTGELAPQAVLTRIEALHDQLATDKAEAIERLKERFNR